jgi:hypothetical protein
MSNDIVPEKLENREEVLKNEPKLTGRNMLVTNPEDGADIFHEKYMFGKPFSLRKGTSKEMDETIAKSAQYSWQFLKIMEIPGQKKKQTEEEKEDTEGKICDVNLLDVDFVYPELDLTKNFDVDKYSFDIQKQIGKAANLQGYQVMKPKTLRDKLLAHPKEDVMNALKFLRIPAYFI